MVCLYEDLQVKSPQILCHSTMESHQKLAKVFINKSFTNSYYQPAKREVSYEQVPKLLHATSCCYVFTTKNYASFFTQLWMQSGYRSTYLQQRCQQVWSIFTSLNDAICWKNTNQITQSTLSNRGHGFFPQWAYGIIKSTATVRTIAGKVCSSLRNQRKSKSEKKNPASFLAIILYYEF